MISAILFWLGWALAVVLAPYWVPHAARRVAALCGRIHPAAELCIRTLDINLGWSERGLYTLTHVGGAEIKLRYNGAIEGLVVGGHPIALNFSSVAALSISTRRWSRAKKRHELIRAAAESDAKTAAFARRIVEICDRQGNVVRLQKGERS